jgi:hypothetical protein
MTVALAGMTVALAGVSVTLAGVSVTLAGKNRPLDDGSCPRGPTTLSGNVSQRQIVGSSGGLGAGRGPESLR